MTSKHTPGPWFSNQGERDGTWKVHDITDREGLLLAEAIKGPDAALIAAAPKLLEACRAAVAWFGAGHPGATEDDPANFVRRQIVAAIKEAEGEP
jgi:hypothetical protein